MVANGAGITIIDEITARLAERSRNAEMLPFAFRMDAGVPLIVPEINPDAAKARPKVAKAQLMGLAKGLRLETTTALQRGLGKVRHLEMPKALHLALDLDLPTGWALVARWGWPPVLQLG